jgi:hypothetical protein
MLRHPTVLAITAVAALVAVTGASADEIVGYTATGSPTHVQPSVQTPFTIALKNTSLNRSADRASVRIPAEFIVNAASVEATATCGAREWDVESPVPSADGKIIVERGSGGSSNNLCPGGTLTVVFSATSADAEGTYTWATELLRGDEDEFVRQGAQPTVKVDGTAPVVTITSRPDDPSSVKSPSFGFSANEPASFQCKLDSGSFTNCTSPKSYSGLSDGAHTFTVKAADAAGNTGQASYTWVLETTLPIVLLAQTPPNPSNTASATFTFQPSKPGATVECKLDSGQFAPCGEPTADGKLRVDYAGLGDGSHAFAARASNAAGNTGPQTLYTWTVDTAGPPTAITERPADPTNGRSATFAFASEAGVTFQCRLDEGPFASCASPHTYAGVGDGRHTFVVRAVDTLGNVGPEAVHAWTIETAAPAVAITAGPPALGNGTAVSLSFSADEAATFQCNLDDRGFEPCGSPAAYAGLREGGHAFVVRATDAAGNVGAASRSWTIDTTAPDTTLASRPPARTTATTAAFRFSTSEAGTFECRLDGGSFSPCTSPKTYRALARGRHSFAVRAVDLAGNVDATPSLSQWTLTAATRRVAASPLFAPPPQAQVTRPPLLRWRAVRRATYYNVQLYRAGRKVLTTWPTRARLQLRARWRFNGRVQTLEPGSYRWYVWPAYGRPSAQRYGRVLGTSTFVVARGARRR